MSTTTIADVLVVDRGPVRDAALILAAAQPSPST